jgi:hypothetical protein
MRTSPPDRDRVATAFHQTGGGLIASNSSSTSFVSIGPGRALAEPIHRYDVQSGMAVGPLTCQASTRSPGPARAGTRRRIAACSGLRGSEVFANGAAGEMLAEESGQE